MAVFFADDFSSRAARQRRASGGEIRSVARGVWTDEHKHSDEEVVQRHWAAIVAQQIPGAVLTDRSGFALRPVGGRLFVSHARQRPLQLPGLTIHPDGRQHYRRSDDIPLRVDGALYAASPARALADNAQRRGWPPKVARQLNDDELHDRVAHIVSE